MFGKHNGNPFNDESEADVVTWWWNRGEKMCEWSETGCILRIILRPNIPPN